MNPPPWHNPGIVYPGGSDTPGSCRIQSSVGFSFPGWIRPAGHVLPGLTETLRGPAKFLLLMIII